MGLSILRRFFMFSNIFKNKYFAYFRINLSEGNEILYTQPHTI